MKLLLPAISVALVAAAVAAGAVMFRAPQRKVPQAPSDLARFIETDNTPQTRPHQLVRLTGGQLRLGPDTNLCAYYAATGFELPKPFEYQDSLAQKVEDLTQRFALQFPNEPCAPDDGTIYLKSYYLTVHDQGTERIGLVAWQGQSSGWFGWPRTAVWAGYVDLPGAVDTDVVVNDLAAKFAADLGVSVDPQRPQSHHFPIRRAAPKGRPGDFISDNDYPAGALRSGKQGTVQFRVDVLQDGRAGDCEITRSSGSDELDRATCVLIERRARFSPATDRDGNFVRGVWSNQVRWQIPKD